MASLVKLDTDGVISTPLAANEIGYSLVKDELYVGSGSGNGTFDSEYRVTRNKELLDTANALAPYSGYTQVSNKLDNFVFQKSSSFLNKVADKNRYVKFGDKVVDTYGDELVTNGDFSDGTTGWSNSSNLTVSNGIGIVAENQTIYYSFPTNIGSTYILTFSVIYQDGTAGNNFGVSARTSSDAFIAGKTGNLSVGVYSIEFVATTSTSRVRLYADGSIGHFDNISVREIQTAQFTVPEVTEIITDGSNTTSVTVNAGDYVVDGSEKIDVLQGTPYAGWSGSSINEAIFSGSASLSSYLNVCANMISGEKYKLSFELTSYTGTDNIGFSTAGGVSVNARLSANGTYEEVFISDGVSLSLFGRSTNTGTITNISVKRVSDTFRAKEDAPIGTALTNTTYFEDRTEIGVTNQQLSYHAYNTLTNSYEGIKTETLFSDVSKEDLLDNPSWLARNGFSKVSDFLYSKGSYLVLPVGIWQSLNKGAYHPVFNPFGCDFTNDALYWYSTSSNYSSTATCFLLKYGQGNIASGTTTARPENKKYDICYSDQFIDVREYAKILNPYEVDLIRDDKIENGIEEVVSFIALGDGTTDIVDYSSQKIKFANGIDCSNINIYDNISVIDYTSNIIHKGIVYDVGSSYVSINSYNQTYAGDSSFDYNHNIVITGTKPILSSNTKLSIDLIGNPTNYPQIMKDRLASGVGVVGVNPLLVGQDGTSYTLVGDGTYDWIIGKKSLSTTIPLLYSLSNGEDWALHTKTVNTITNNITGTISSGWLSLISYTSKNHPYIQTTPKPVIEVEPKVIASSSHSIHKGCMMTAQITGKIPTGS